MRKTFNKSCALCSKIFTSVTKNTRFCSAKCAANGRKERQSQWFSCVECGNLFTAVNARAKLCSNACINKRKESLDKKVEIDCRHCGKSFEVSERRKNKAKYCSWKCRDASRSFVSQIPCAHCGSPFKPRTPNTKFCSMTCMGKSKANLVKTECKFCGKGKLTPQHLLDIGKGGYCNTECFRSYQEEFCYENISCQVCGESFRSRKAERRVCCGENCRNTYVKRLTAPTSIEVAIANGLKFMGVEFISEYPVGRYTCDFYIPSANLVVECDGDYWHSIPQNAARDRRKDAALQKAGYSIIRLAERKIVSHLDLCLEEIRSRINSLDKI